MLGYIDKLDTNVMPRVTLEQWRVLQAVVDEGSYARAAEALARSQSSISYAIQRLQEQLGTQVLRLRGRNIGTKHLVECFRPCTCTGYC